MATTMGRTIEQQAQALYDAWQAEGATWAKMGMTLRGLQASRCNATLEEIAAHVALCRALSEQYRVTLDPAALWGSTPEDVRARALGKARSNAGRRGVKALENTYGHEFAAKLVHEKSGRTIRS